MTESARTRSYTARRNAARLAAVQALYQMEISGRGASGVIREFVDDRLLEEGEAAEDLDPALFRALVEGVVSAQDDIDANIAGVLAEGWKLKRIDATARAILRAGAFEILHRSDIPPAAAVDAYVGVARAFFDGPEPGFINAALDALAKARAQPPASGGAGETASG